MTQAQADSYGQRQIIMVLEERGANISSSNPFIYLRLSSDHTAQGLANFLLYKKLYLKKRGKLCRRIIL